MPGKLPMSSLTEAIVETITQPLLVLDGELRVKAANRAFLQHFGVEPAETLGCLVYDLGNGQWNIPGLRRLLEEVLSQNGQVVDYRVEHDFESIGERIMLLNGTRMRREDTTDTILLAITDITERERLRFELEGQKEFTEKLIDSVRESLVVLGWDLRIRWRTYRRNDRTYLTFEMAGTRRTDRGAGPGPGFGAKVRAKFSAHAGRHGGAKLYSQWRGMPARISTICPSTREP